MAIEKNFESFVNSLHLSKKEISIKSSSFRLITKILNNKFHNSKSDTANATYVGGTLLGTEIHIDDLAMLYVLPNSLITANPIDLLELSKNTLETISDDVSIRLNRIRIKLANDATIEIILGFMDNIDHNYLLISTNKKLQKANFKLIKSTFDELNKKCNDNFINLAKMIREWAYHNKVNLPYELIDAMSYQFLTTYKYRNKGYLYYDCLIADFIKYMIDNYKEAWYVPGTEARITKPSISMKKAKITYQLAIEAIEHNTMGRYKIALAIWQEIFGENFK